MTCSRTEARSGARISSIFGSAIFKSTETGSFLFCEPLLALPQCVGSSKYEILLFTEKYFTKTGECCDNQLVKLSIQNRCSGTA